MMTDHNKELLPCPFCGKSDFLIERLDSDASVVICQGMIDKYSACLARGPVGVQDDDGEDQPGKDAAVREWNARAQQPASVAVQDGWRLVPIDPTVEMRQALYTELNSCDVWRAMLAAAPNPVSGEQKPAHWRAVLHADQRPQQLHDKHVVVFTNREAAEAWVAEKKDFQGWDYSIEALYTSPQPAPDVQGLVEALEHARRLREVWQRRPCSPRRPPRPAWRAVMTETVSMPRHLLVLLQERLDPHRDANAWGEVCALLESPAPTLDYRLRASGMLSVAERMAGAPLDGFIKHSGVRDIATFSEWVEMRRRECLRLQARFDLKELGEDHELYEWALAHTAVFTEVHVNLRAALAGEPKQ